MNKLTRVETQRVMSVLGETLDRINYLSYVPVEFNAALVEALTENRCSEGSEQLTKLWHLEKKIKTLHDINSPEIDQTETQVFMSTRNLCRTFRENPIAVEALYQSCSGSRTKETMQFLQALSELTDQTHKKLMKTAEEDTIHSKTLKNISVKKEELEKEIAALQVQLSEERKTKNEHISKLEIKVHKLKSEIQDITQSSEYNIDLITKEMKEKLDKAYHEHVMAVTSLHEEKTLLQQKYDKMVGEDHDEEASWRKKKSKETIELQTLINKYDEDMRSITNQLEDVQKNYTLESQQLAELDEYFQKVDAEQNRIDAEEAIIAAKLEKERQEEQKLHDGATQIQRIFRGFLARKEVNKRRSKKKGGKKKGGKKK